MEKLSLGVVHGRFQPPHLGHVRYLLAAFARTERVVIGIATPRICSEEEAARTGYPCTAALNPFSYEDRMGMISTALDEAGIARERYSFVDFPSNYEESSLARIVPKDAVFLMSVTSGGDKGKIAHLASLGYATEIVIEIPESEEREHAGGVRESVRAGTDAWRALVPKSIASYMESHGLLDKLRR